MRADPGLSRWMRGLRRPTSGRLVGGVCASLAYGLVVDVTLLRLSFLLLALANGLGLLLYLALWLLTPGEDSEEERGSKVVWSNLMGLRYELYAALARLKEALSRNSRVPWPVPLDRRWIALGLVAGGALMVLYTLGVFAWLNLPRALGLAAMAAGSAVLVSTARRD